MIMKKSAVVVLALLSLAACTSKSHPKMLSFTPASVVVDYSNNDLHEATSLAQQFCSSINKDAQYVRTNEGSWMSRERHAFFNCVGSATKGNQHNSSGSNSSNMPIINNFK
jgi:predicted small lipoprotein YifL